MRAYETGKLTPAIPALIRLAEALNASIDYLIIDGAPRQPLSTANTELAQRLNQLGQPRWGQAAVCSWWLAARVGHRSARRASCFGLSVGARRFT